MNYVKICIFREYSFNIYNYFSLAYIVPLFSNTQTSFLVINLNFRTNKVVSPMKPITNMAHCSILRNKIIV